MSFSFGRLAALVSMVCCVACSRSSGLPKVDSKQYRDAVGAFYVGLAGLQTGEDVRAKEQLTTATQFAPGEPASWADLALLAVRQQNFDEAYNDAEKARSLAPDNSRIEMLLGLIESRRGKLVEAIGYLDKAVVLDAGNLKALYALAQETERQGAAANDSQAKDLIQRALNRRPRNLALLLEDARLAAKSGDAAALDDAVQRLNAASFAWPDEAKQQMATLQESTASGNPRAAALRAVFLRNVLARVPQYRRDLEEVQTPATFVSDPFTAFLKMAAPASDPAGADLNIRFDAAPASFPAGVLWAGALPLDQSGKPTVFWADRTGVHIAGGAHLPFLWMPGSRITGADLNYDFLTDLIVAGPSGLHIFQQKDIADFGEMRLPAGIADGAYNGAWPFDIDLDGDLDIVLGNQTGEPRVLRNNADGTFAVIHPFAGIDGLIAFAATASDVAMIDRSGSLHVFANERLGVFRARVLPPKLGGRFAAVRAADIKGDGVMDFVLLRDDGTVVRFSDGIEIAKAGRAPSPALLIADLDNNGALDLIVNGQVFMGNGKHFTKLPNEVLSADSTAIDLNADGRLDLIDAKGIFLNHGVKNYHWQDIQLRAATATGDQRINSFGIGGEVEIRSGLLAQKQMIEAPLVHFGLGDRTQVDVARITWPNGVAQAEFALKANLQILAQQRLKGSCPWLFAWDGKRMSFVKDGSPWSPALGLHINAQVVAGIGQTQEWFKIPGQALQARDGYYDLRVTGELWETYYIDHYSLMVVDHPESTAIYSDERFAVPAPPLKIYTTSVPQPFVSAHDDLGSNVSETVRTLDGDYLDTFGRGPYQGLTRDHWVQLELPAAAPEAGPLYLLASGWLHPTDATVNIAIGQSSIPQPRGLSIEVADRTGKWHVAKENLGFPAGKMKTVVLDLSGIFLPEAPRKLRLRTNLEIYWDKLEWATAAPDRNRIQHLALASADLHYRGFSEVKAANKSSPELPDYGRIVRTGQIWRDLEGYSTRYGDIRELLEKIDDRIVIVNAGDEVRLRFTAPPDAPKGWKRDFIMVADGWIKDGDFNSTFSKTVLPLPYHGMKDYTTPPGRLEDDPAYKLHPDDWQKFHTRYVTADAFERALRN